MAFLSGPDWVMVMDRRFAQLGKAAIIEAERAKTPSTGRISGIFSELVDVFGRILVVIKY
jgi:hypothetical protein